MQRVTIFNQSLKWNLALRNIQLCSYATNTTRTQTVEGNELPGSEQDAYHKRCLQISGTNTTKQGRWQKI